MIGEMVRSVQEGDDNLALYEVEAADRAIVEQEPRAQVERGLPPGEFEDGAHQVHEESAVTDDGHTLDRLTFAVAVAGQLDYVEMRKVSADERAVWQTRCRPRDVTDRYGVVHVVYAAAGCQYGP